MSENERAGQAEVMIHDVNHGRWASINLIAGTWGVSVFPGTPGSRATILRVVCDGVKLSFLGSDREVVGAWSAIRSAVYGSGPAGDMISSDIRRCRVALGEFDAEVAHAEDEAEDEAENENEKQRREEEATDEADAR